jgi:hypothetical protein
VYDLQPDKTLPDPLQPDPDHPGYAALLLRRSGCVRNGLPNPGNSHTNAHPHRHSYFPGDDHTLSNLHPFPQPDAQQYPHCQPDCHHDTNLHTHLHPFSHPDQHAQPERDADHPFSHPNQHAGPTD